MLLFFSTHKHTSKVSRAILLNFLEDEQITQNHPQSLSGLSCALFATTFFEMAVYFEVADTTLILKSWQIIARNACLAEAGEAWVKKKQQREIYTEEKKKQKKEKSKKSRGLYTT